MRDLINITRKMDAKDAKQYNERSSFKGWFCTWPQCPVTKEDALTILNTNGLPQIVEYVIAEEKHENGDPHLHGFLKFGKKVRFGQIMKKLDLLEYHGNYQPAKSWKAVEAYCKKDGNYISNINLENAKKKQSKMKKEDLLKDIDQVLDEGLITPMQVASFYKNSQIYKMLQQKRERMPEKLPPKQRHLWFYGGSNTGKTYKLREMMKQTGEEKWFQIPTNNDWIGYNGEKYLYMDEFKGQLSIQQLNNICDGNYKVNVKGGSTWIGWECQVVICSNYSIKDCYNKCEDNILETLYNRFVEKELLIKYH